MFQVTQIVRFLLALSLSAVKIRFPSRSLGFCGHASDPDLLETVTFNAPVPVTVCRPGRTRLFPTRHFLKAMVHLSVIRILRLRSASEI